MRLFHYSLFLNCETSSSTSLVSLKKQISTTEASLVAAEAAPREGSVFHPSFLSAHYRCYCDSQAITVISKEAFCTFLKVQPRACPERAAGACPERSEWAATRGEIPFGPGIQKIKRMLHPHAGSKGIPLRAEPALTLNEVKGNGWFDFDFFQLSHFYIPMACSALFRLEISWTKVRRR